MVSCSASASNPALQALSAINSNGIRKPAGQKWRHAIGTAVFGGTLVATVLGIFFIPLFYVVVRGLAGASLVELKTPVAGYRP